MKRYLLFVSALVITTGLFAQQPQDAQKSKENGRLFPSPVGVYAGMNATKSLITNTIYIEAFPPPGPLIRLAGGISLHQFLSNGLFLSSHLLHETQGLKQEFFLNDFSRVISVKWNTTTEVLLSGPLCEIYSIISHLPLQKKLFAYLCTSYWINTRNAC